MAYNTKEILKDKDLNPISQYYNPTLDKYEAVEGASGGNKVVLYNEDGTENNGLSLIPILDKLTQLTGTVIDENTRKSNELLRIALYNNIDNLLTTGQLKGDKGDIGKGLEYNWSGTQLGVRVMGDPSYTYVQLKGDKGDKGETGATGSIDSLDSTHISTALGFLPKDYTAGAGLELNGSEFKSIVTKTTIGLGNVTDHKQMPISNGILENYNEKTITITDTLNIEIDASLASTFAIIPLANTTISIINVGGMADKVKSITLIIASGTTPVSYTFTNTISWGEEGIPDMSEPNKIYYITLVKYGNLNWAGFYGGAR